MTNTIAGNLTLPRQLAGGAGQPARRRPAERGRRTANGECAGLTTANPCATGTLASGMYHGFTVYGTCNVAFNAQVTVNGDLDIADGGVFGGIIPSSVHVTGDVNVGRGALLGLGYATTTDVVDGASTRTARCRCISGS